MQNSTVQLVMQPQTFAVSRSRVGNAQCSCSPKKSSARDQPGGQGAHCGSFTKVSAAISPTGNTDDDDEAKLLQTNHSAPRSKQENTR